MIETLDKNSSTNEVVQALKDDGGVIVANLVSEDVVDRVVKELRPHYDAQGTKFQDDFNGYTTLRLYAAAGVSRGGVRFDCPRTRHGNCGRRLRSTLRQLSTRQQYRY